VAGSRDATTGVIERDPHTMETLVGQAKNWIYPKIGARKLRDFTATDADNFLSMARLRSPVVAS
jgi:hypothetical protein